MDSENKGQPRQPCTLESIQDSVEKKNVILCDLVAAYDVIHIVIFCLPN
jgi:hypothetical protein